MTSAEEMVRRQCRQDGHKTKLSDKPTLINASIRLDTKCNFRKDFSEESAENWPKNCLDHAYLQAVNRGSATSLYPLALHAIE